MAINIFANAEAATPKPSSNIMGRFRAGRQLQGRPMNLTTWRVTSGDPDVVKAIADQYGAIEGPQEWETKTDERLEVITEASSVAVILDNPRSISSEMVLWGRKGKLRSCDGVTQAAKEGQPAKPCECPSDMSERIAQASDGLACDPSISYLFRLADLPELGRFRFQTGSWTVARQVSALEKNLVDIFEDNPEATGANATLTLEQRTRSDSGSTYTIALLDITGPATATIEKKAA